MEMSRMTLMWCSFDRNPLILRAYGDAVAVHPRDAAWRELITLFPSIPGTRQLLDLHVNMVGSSPLLVSRSTVGEIAVL
jgi:hypothetical protein